MLHKHSARLYENDRDLLDILAFIMEGCALAGVWAYPHPGEFLFNYFMILCQLDPTRHIRLWSTPAGRLAGYAMLGEDPALDFRFSPEAAWCGLEEEALEWAASLAADLAQVQPADWGGPIVATARQDDTTRITFLENHGFTYRGSFAEVNMLRSLSDPTPTPSLPAGVAVRPILAPSEIPARAALHRAVWEPWTVAKISDEDHPRYMALPMYQSNLDLVSFTPDGVMAAYVTGWLDPLTRTGELGPVGTHPEYRQRGFARLALLEALRRMQAHGMERVQISTGVANTAARNLYESIGFWVVNQTLDFHRTK